MLISCFVKGIRLLVVIGFGDDDAMKEDCSNPLCNVLQSLFFLSRFITWTTQLCSAGIPEQLSLFSLQKKLKRKDIRRQEHIPR